MTRRVSHGRAATALVAVAIVGALAIGPTQPAQAQTFKLLYTFTNGADGNTPYAGLTLDAAGNLYGTTNACNQYGCGTVFKLTPSQGGWTFTVLYNFLDTQYCGGSPTAGVVLDSNGNLYTAAQGQGKFGGGVLVKIDSSGKCTALHSFERNGGAQQPSATPILDAAGNLYGDTDVGNQNGVHDVWEYSPTKPHYDILHAFKGLRNVAEPLGNMFRDAAGNLYGAGSGGYNKHCIGCGVVYKLSPSGTETRLHHFIGSDGAYPSGGVTAMDAAGNIYGTTYGGGNGNCTGGFAGPGCGVVYKITPQGDFSLPYQFKTDSDGCCSEGGPILDSAGNLYGVTAGGGANGEYGTVFKLDPAGHHTILYSFTGGSDGLYPTGPLVMDKAGNLYGTTCCGGSGGYGTIFEITP